MNVSNEHLEQDVHHTMVAHCILEEHYFTLKLIIFLFTSNRLCTEDLWEVGFSLSPGKQGHKQGLHSTGSQTWVSTIDSDTTRQGQCCSGVYFKVQYDNYSCWQTSRHYVTRRRKGKSTESQKW